MLTIFFRDFLLLVCLLQLSTGSATKRFEAVKKTSDSSIFFPFYLLSLKYICITAIKPVTHLNDLRLRRATLSKLTLVVIKVGNDRSSENPSSIYIRLSRFKIKIVVRRKK